MGYDVISFGDLVADLLLPIPKLPLIPNEDQLAHIFLVEPGGAGNFLIMAARLGLRAAAISCVGLDVYGSHIKDQLKQEGVNVSDVQVLPGQRTTLVLVFIDDAGEHVFLGVPGTVEITEIRDSHVEKIAQAKAFYIAGYAFGQTNPSHLVTDAIQLAKENGVVVFFDPGPQAANIAPDLMDSAVSNSDVLLATLEEVIHLTGDNPPEQVAQELLSRGPKLVVIKMGSEGCLVAREDNVFKLDAFSVNARDTTGAGDAFDAAWVYGILRGLPLEQTGVIANAVGAATATKIGAGTRLPNREEVVALLRENSVDPAHIKGLGIS